MKQKTTKNTTSMNHTDHIQPIIFPSAKKDPKNRSEQALSQIVERESVERMDAPKHQI